MGLLVSAAIPGDNQPLNQEAKSVQEIVREQPKLRNNFDAEDNPVVTAGCCFCCVDPNCLCCDCCDSWGCCDWLLCHCCCDLCTECDECCGECIKMCC